MLMLIKEALKKPIEPSPYAASREASEECRLMLLNFVNSIEPDKQYVEAMTSLPAASSRKYASCLPSQRPFTRSLRKSSLRSRA